MKFIVFNALDGRYAISLKKVAENRAEYYADTESFAKDSAEWKGEINYILNSEYDGIDWLLNNTDWEDWEDIAILLDETVKTTDPDFWSDSDNFEVKIM